MAALSAAKRLVVKIGSSLLVADGRLRSGWLRDLALDIRDIKARGVDLILLT